MEIKNDLTRDEQIHTIAVIIRDYAISIEENAHYSDDNYITQGVRTPLTELLELLADEIITDMEDGARHTLYKEGSEFVEDLEEYLRNKK